MAGHFWPRLLTFILFPVIFDLLIQFFISNFFPNTSQDTTFVFIVIIASLISILVTLVLWSFLLSGWLRHELIPDDTPYPLSAKDHFRALCWHQFFSILLSGLITFAIAIPFVVLGMALLKTFTELIVIYEIEPFGIYVGLYTILIILFFIPLFFGMIFYFRYSVGALSLTLYGQKMSLSDASAYSTEHEPSGLTRRYAT
ncbi:MAG: hypothetical protein ACPH3M_09940 [Candidatus Puniceispirillales bacterium]